MGKNKKQFYAVAVGRTPGIYISWDDCKMQTDRFKAAKFKSFFTKEEAQAFIEAHCTEGQVEETLITQSRSLFETCKTDTVTPAINVPMAKRQKVAPHPKHSIHISINFDGGSRGNPGIGGAGAQLLVTEISKFETGKIKKRETLLHLSRFLGSSQGPVTNNEAEYHGLLLALEEARKQVQSFQARRSSQSLPPTPPAIQASLQIRGDSDLILKQMQGKYLVKSQNLVPLHCLAKQLVASMQAIMNTQVHYEHVRRVSNSCADALVNQAIDSQSSSNTVISTRYCHDAISIDPAIPGGLHV